MPVQPSKHPPHKLSAQEISNPFLVLADFFTYSHLPGVREQLWLWLKTTVSGSYNDAVLTRIQRHNMIFFYEHIEKLIEAAHLIHLRQTQKSLPKKPNQKHKPKHRHSKPAKK